MCGYLGCALRKAETLTAPARVLYFIQIVNTVSHFPDRLLPVDVLAI